MGQTHTNPPGLTRQDCIKLHTETGDPTTDFQLTFSGNTDPSGAGLSHIGPGVGRSAGVATFAVGVTGLRMTNAVRLGPRSAATRLLRHTAVPIGFGVVSEVLGYPGP